MGTTGINVVVGAVASWLVAFSGVWLPAEATGHRQRESNRQVTSREERPLTTAELRSVQRLAPRVPLDLSADGTRVAYTVVGADNVAAPPGGWPLFTATGVSPENLGAEVWVASLAGGPPQRISARGASGWAPRWSPDSKRVAFFSDAGGRARLWIWDASTGRATAPSPAPVRTYFGFEVPRWTPDGGRVLVKLLPEGSPLSVPTETLKYGNDEETSRAASSGAKVRVFTSPDTSSGLREGPSARLAYRADLALIDVQSGAATRLARNVVPFGYWPSPDGRFVAFLDRRGWVPDSQQPVFALEIAATTGRPNRRVLVDDVRQQYGISLSWAPDGSRLAYTTFSQLSDGKCYVVTLDGDRRSFGEPSQPLGAAYAAPVWSPDGRQLYLLAGRAVHRLTPETGVLEQLGASDKDLTVLAVAPVAGSEHLAHPPGGSIVVAVNDRATGEQGVAEVTAAGALKRRHMAPQSLGLRPQFTIARNADRLIAATETTDTPQQLSVVALDTGERRAVAPLNPDLHDRPWGRSTFIDWRVPSGATIRGAVLLPPGFARGQERPAVVLVYGGSRQSEQAFAFDPKLQMWLTRGYVVFLPDMPMGRGQPVKDIVDTVVGGVDRLIADGYVHPKRIGVWGWSYGGYSTLALLTRSDRFRAGVAGAGFGNLFSQYGTLSSGGSDSVGYLERGQGGLDAHPWNDRERYIENSPFFFLDRISGPVLIVHGAQDTAVPVQMSHEVFVGLRRLGKRAELVVYLDEDHTIERRHNSEDYWNRMIQWFGEHLQQPTAARMPSH